MYNIAYASGSAMNISTTTKSFDSFAAFGQAFFGTPSSEAKGKSGYILRTDTVTLYDEYTTNNGDTKHNIRPRCDKAIPHATLIVLEGDSKPEKGLIMPSFDDAAAALRLLEVEAIIHTSSSHTPTAPCWHIYINVPPYNKSRVKALTEAWRYKLNQFMDVPLPYHPETVRWSQPWFPSGLNDDFKYAYIPMLSTDERRASITSADNYYTELLSLAQSMANQGILENEIIADLKLLMATSKPALLARNGDEVDFAKKVAAIPGLVKSAIVNAAEFLQPIPLSNVNAFIATPCPTDCVPAEVLQMANEVAKWSSTNVEPCIVLGINVLSAAINKSVRINIKQGLWTYCSLATIIAAPSGYRKSSIYDIIGAELFEYERQLEQDWENAKTTNKTMIGLLTQQIAKIHKDNKNKSFTPTELLEQANGPLGDLQRELEKYEAPRPTLIMGDVTESELVYKLAENNATMAIISDDARKIVKRIMGTSRGDDSGEDVYIAGFTKGTVSWNRVGQKDNRIDIKLRDMCLNSVLFIQPDIAKKLAVSEAYVSSGLIARMPLLYTHKDTADIFSETTDTDINMKEMAAYNNLLHAACYDKPERTLVINLSAEARAAWLAFNHTLGSRLRDEWAGYDDMVNKAATQAASVAGIYAIQRVVQSGAKMSDIDTRVIEVEAREYKMACSYIVWLLTESIKSYNHALQEGKNNDVVKVLALIKKKFEGKPEIQVRDLSPLLKGSARDSIHSIIETLVDTRWLKRRGANLLPHASIWGQSL